MQIVFDMPSIFGEQVLIDVRTQDPAREEVAETGNLLGGGRPSASARSKLAHQASDGVALGLCALHHCSD